MKNQTINRKSFIIHADSLDILDQLTDEQAGKLFKAISYYQKTGEISQVDQLVKIAITPFINQFKRDEEKYLNIVERNKINISKRWSKDTTGKTGIPKDTKNTDNDSKSDNDSDSKNKKDSKNKNFTPPTLEEVKNYCQERKNNVNAKKWFDFYSAKGWKIGKNSMKDWKAAVRTWEEDTSPTNQDPLANKLNQIAGGSYFKSVVIGNEVIITCNDGMKTKAYSLPEEIKNKIKAEFKQSIQIN
jgi:hypothetical protein